MNITLLQSRFNAQWYLATYPDVAAAGIDPWQHYLRFGKAEGRLPFAISALQLENQLWQAEDALALLTKLHQLTETDNATEADMARWVMARWHSSYGRWSLVPELLQFVVTNPVVLALLPPQAPWLVYFEALLNTDQIAAAARVLASTDWPDAPDKQLAASMLQSGGAKLQHINAVWQAVGLNTVDVAETLVSLDTLQARPCTHAKGWLSPLVSVIMPCYNAAKTIATALRSLQQQSWQKLEIIVVDDASTDNSVEIALKFAAKDKRIRVLRQEKNAGAYAARNRAMAVAKGRFITTHDCDDWSHPQKIALQLNALQRNRKAMACTSSWVRCTAALHFSRWRMEEGWIYRNTSSLMFRRKVFATLGYWDRVSVNADTEYYYRIKRAFGPHSVIEVLPTIPLALGRADSGSLSQTSATHLRTQFSGVRRDYHQAAIHWHETSSEKQLFLPAAPNDRPFAVPALICRGTERQRQHNLGLLLTEKGYFDAAWYLRCYADVAASGMDPLTHFVRFGAAEGRDPAADVSNSGLQLSMALQSGSDWLNWLVAQSQRPDALVQFEGRQSADANKPVILCFAHQASAQSFGAERSFLDVLAALGDSYRLVVCLPHILSKDYLTAITTLCHKVVVTPYYWWRGGREPETVVQARLTMLMQQLSPAAIYCNTLTLFEPALSARQLAIPVITHVRELPAADVQLCQLMAATPEQLRAHVVALSTRLIANSQLVADYLAAADITEVVANCFDIAQWPALPLPDGPPYRVAMCSSNLLKKGVRDFVAVAQQALMERLPLQFNMYGPDNDVLAAIRSEGVPDNLKICGYQPDIKQALADNHIVLSLSHFQESFGRNVLEAMLLQRAVIAYDWGAVPELLAQQRGVLVPYKDVAAVVNTLAIWCRQPEQIADYAIKARRFAEHYCDVDAFKLALDKVFKDRY